MRPLKCSVISLIIALGLAKTAVATEPTKDELVAGAVARRTAIFSGTIDYVRITGFRHSPGDDLEVRHVYSKSGDNWARRWPNAIAGTKINVGETLFEFAPVEIGNTGRSVLQVKNPMALETVETNPGVYYIGTIWFARTAEYMKSHITEATIEEKCEVNGQETWPISWKVPKDARHNAFHWVTEPINEGGVLRVFIAPQLGYGTPKIEYRSADGFLAFSFDSLGFSEVGGGIYFPKTCKLQTYQPHPSTYEDYEIQSVANINGVVPADEFRMDIPKGTRVRYSRGRKGAIVFDLGEQVRSDEIEQQVPGLRAAAEGLSAVRKAVIAVNGAVVMCIVVLLIVRSRRAYAQAIKT